MTNTQIKDMTNTQTDDMTNKKINDMTNTQINDMTVTRESMVGSLKREFRVGNLDVDVRTELLWLRTSDKLLCTCH